MITCNVFVKAGFLSIRLEFFLFKGCLTLFYVLPTDSNDQLFAGYMDRPEQVRNNLLFGENLDLEGEGQKMTILEGQVFMEGQEASGFHVLACVLLPNHTA